MESPNGLSSNSRNFSSISTSRQLLPPMNSSYLCSSTSHSNSSSVVALPFEEIPKPKPQHGQGHHQPCSSQIFLIEEQPSWLDDLLNDHEISSSHHKSHRRSSSDSSAYLGAAAAAIKTKCPGQENRFTSLPDGNGPHSWDNHNFTDYENFGRTFIDNKDSSIDDQHHVPCDSFSNFMASIHPQASSTRNALTVALHPVESTHASAQESGEQDSAEFSSPNQDPSTKIISDCSQTKSLMSKSEAKRIKQQSAHRSRVKKLQYIAELERVIQALQAEGYGVSAELEFLDQQNLILGMENRVLRKRLESVSQEQLIKQLEHDMLERELGRLQTLYQLQRQPQVQRKQQKPQQQQHFKHRRAKSRDIESQFANLSIKHHKESGSSGGGSING